MKKLLLAFIICTSLGLCAQNFMKFKNTESVHPIAMGQSVNAYSIAYNRTTLLWAVNEINSISFIHRSDVTPGGNWLSYDVSTDGGQTWSVNNQVYDPTIAGASPPRYPQGFLYNPVGNTDPDEAYFSYFSATTDGSNGPTWGGYCWGTKKLATGAFPTQNNLSSGNDFYLFIPSGFTLTQLGESWVVDEENEYDGTGSSVFTDNLIVGHGVWNDVSEDFNYTFDHLYLEVDDESEVKDVKVAFAPDGMTGWICAIAYNSANPIPSTWYHPILFKTTDGGQTWSDPIDVQLGGADGFEEVVNFISDEDLIEFYTPDPVPFRDDIPYAFDDYIDMSVDAWGNPHIMGAIGICDMETQERFFYEGVFAMFHIYSKDQGETWEAFLIDYPMTWSATYEGNPGSFISMYNRAQVSTTQDGAIVFFSFLDTRIEGFEDNSLPDIYFREYIPEPDIHGDAVINVTENSAATWQSRWGCMSHYVFADVTDNGNYQCTIPFAYQELTNENISEPVQFWYIPDFQRSYILTGVEEDSREPLVSLAQNFPNPFSETTHFNINLLKKCDVSIEVCNVSGQLIKQFHFNQLANGPHQLTLHFGNIKAGVYFYNLKAGESKYNGKMIVQ